MPAQGAIRRHRQRRRSLRCRSKARARARARKDIDCSFAVRWLLPAMRQMGPQAEQLLRDDPHVAAVRGAGADLGRERVLGAGV
eukprot:2319818-Heterocapsa_arctica.AAC.1